MAHHYVCLQDIRISFWHVDFYATISVNLDTRVRNSTTQLTIIGIVSLLAKIVVLGVECVITRVIRHTCSYQSASLEKPR